MCRIKLDLPMAHFPRDSQSGRHVAPSQATQHHSSTEAVANECEDQKLEVPTQTSIAQRMRAARAGARGMPAGLPATRDAEMDEARSSNFEELIHTGQRVWMTLGAQGLAK